MERRQILAVVLMFLVLVVYQVFYVERFQKKTKVKKPPAQVEEQAASPAKSQAPEPPPAPVAKPPVVPSAKAEDRLVRVETDLYEATFSARGAALVSFKLREYPLVPGQDKGLVDLVPEGERALLVRFETPALEKFSTEGLYSASASELVLSEAQPSGELTFSQTGPGGEQVVKRFTFKQGKYGYDLDLYVKRQKGSEAPLKYRIHWAYDLGGATDGYGAYTTVSHLVKGKRLTEKPGKLPDVPVVHEGEAGWSAIQTKYFAAFLAPRDGHASAAVAKKTVDKVVERGTWIFGLGPKKEVVQKVAHLSPGLAFNSPGDAARSQFLLYGGPKIAARLNSYGEDIGKVIDYGWFGPISRPLLVVLRFLNGFIGNYGVSIIVLTILIKLCFFPLSIKQQENMRQMSRLQPKLKTLQERYKGDKEKLNKEIMELYRREKVNPLGGCLPLLIQFPVIIALYRVLGDAVDLRGAPFAFWINDLSVPDTLFYPWLHILPILMGATMLIQNHISPAAMGGAGADPRQQQMIKYMPIIFLFIFWKFPAGLNLYWTVYTILGIGEQFLVKRKFAAKEAKAS